MSSPAQPELSPDQYMLARTVSQDLRALSRWKMSTDEEDLRRESAVLRRLLVEGDYLKAWKILKLPKTPIINAPDFDASLGSLDRRYLMYAFAPSPDNLIIVDQKIIFKIADSVRGGDLMMAVNPKDGRTFPSMLVIPSAELAFVKDREAYAGSIAANVGDFKSRCYWLSAFMESPCAAFGEQSVTRRELIKYVANRLGGAHYGSSERQDARRVIDLLDKPYVLVNNTLPVYLQLVYIGRALTDSSDAFRYQECFRKIAPPASPFDS